MRDLDLRKVVRDELHRRHLNQADTLIVEEMGVWSGSARVDIAVINGEMHGLELKSARDNLDRLPLQADLYSSVFDKITLILADKHRIEAARLVPAWWGITIAHQIRVGEIKLEPIRAEEPNPTPSQLQLARLLWQNERVLILTKYAAIRGFRSADSEKMCRRLVDVLDLETLQSEVRLSFKARTRWLRKPVAY